MDGYNKFSNATEDKVFLSSYYNSLISNKKFKNAIRDGIKNGNNKTQFFEDEINRAWHNYLIETGRATSTQEKALDKWSIASKVFEILEEVELDNFTFRIIDPKKYIGAIKVASQFYEVKVVRHTKSQTPDGNVVVAKELFPFIKELADKLSDVYSLMIIKNNQITIETEDKEQLSIKVTKKKQVLF